MGMALTRVWLIMIQILIRTIRPIKKMKVTSTKRKTWIIGTVRDGTIIIIDEKMVMFLVRIIRIIKWYK